MSSPLSRCRRALAGSAILFVAAAATANAATPGGLTISNTVVASYADRVGNLYSAQSNTIVETTASVAAISLAPNTAAANAATDGIPQNQPATRTFTISNVSNIADAYTITAAGAGPGTITSIAFGSGPSALPVTLNSTVSPTVPIGGSIAVTVTVATAGIAIGTTFAVTLSARTTVVSAANGLQSATAEQWFVVQSGPLLAGIGGPASPIVVTNENVESSAIEPGAMVAYEIDFKNYGGSPANATVVTDILPPGLLPDLTSVTINGQPAGSRATLNGQILSIALGSVPSGATIAITFTALAGPGLVPGSSYSNTLQISAATLPVMTSNPTTVLIGASNLLYDGDAGTAQPLGGAIVTLLDATTLLPVPVETSAQSRRRHSALAASAAPAMTNPFITGTDGWYGFDLSPAQLGSVAHPARYVLTVADPAYLPRRINIELQRTGVDGLSTVTMSSADGQPLGAPGGFSLVSTPVHLSDVSDLLGNIPLFRITPITLTNAVDRDVAAAGDRLIYTISASPGSTDALGETRITATLPAGVAYAPLTARVDGVRHEPLRSGPLLEWTLPTVGAQHLIVYSSVILAGVQEGQRLVNVAAADALAARGQRVGASATAQTVAIGGVLSDRMVITGRAFLDVRGSGRFERSDVGVANVRVFLENGESVTTDRFGRFSFPAVRPGQHVLRLDTTTLPANIRASTDLRYDSPHSTVRLIHGLMDAGLMQDVEFALDAVR